jgi:hypothetical protein
MRRSINASGFKGSKVLVIATSCKAARMSAYGSRGENAALGAGLL